MYARSGGVAGRCLLEFLMEAPLSGGGAHSGNGSGNHRPSLVAGGVVDLPCAARGATQMAG